MIQTPPTIRLSDFVRTLKAFTTFHIGETRASYLRHIYWHEHTFWSDGYLIATTGEVSAETLKH